MQRKRNSEQVLRVSIAGMDFNTAFEVLEDADERALRLLRISTRHFVAPTVLRYFDSDGCLIAALSRSSKYLRDVSAGEKSAQEMPNLTSTLEITDDRGRKATVRIEVEGVLREIHA